MQWYEEKDNQNDTPSDASQELTQLLKNIDLKILNNIYWYCDLFQEWTISKKKLYDDIHTILKKSIREQQEYIIITQRSSSVIITKWRSMYVSYVLKQCAIKHWQSIENFEGKNAIQKFVNMQIFLKRLWSKKKQVEIKHSLHTTFQKNKTPSTARGLSLFAKKWARVWVAKSVILPPDSIHRSAHTQQQNAKERVSGIDKLSHFVKILEYLEKQWVSIDWKTIEVLPWIIDNISRKQSYIVVTIPSLNKSIIINNEYGEAIYYFEYIVSKEQVKLFGKTKQRELLWAKKISFDYNNPENTWWIILRFLVNTTSVKENKEVTTKQKMDKVYFDNIKNVRYDLQAYADKLWVEIYQLTTHKLSKHKAILSTHENLWWEWYLYRASRYISWNKNKVLQELLKSIWISSIKTNKEYFNNKNYVYQDLKSFASKAWVDVRRLKVNDRKKAKISTWETIALMDYLSRANRLFSLTSWQALDQLLKTAWIKRVAFDVVYFNTKKYIFEDLKSFSNEVDIKISDLTSHKLKGAKIMASNWKMINFEAYIAKAYSIHWDSGWIMNKLREVAWLKSKLNMDVMYFSNQEYVKNDLLKYVVLIWGSISDLNYNKVSKHTVLVSSGYTLTGDAYIRRAMRSLWLLWREETINRLKKIAWYRKF